MLRRDRHSVVAVEPVGPYTLLRVGRGDLEPGVPGQFFMLEAVRSLAPDAQLAWEAPMACGYGACYGCVVELGGRYARLCVEGPVLCSS